MILNYKIIPVMVAIFIIVVETAISFNSVLLPDIKQDFVISETIAQSTISVCLFMLGFAGIVYGAITDSIGRRPIFLFSIGIFSVASLVCANATNINIFMIAKFFQGIGSGAGWVVGNACVKDLYSGKAYTKMMNHIHAVVGIVPAISPVLGSYVAVLLGWRQCFVLLFILSLVIFLLMFFYQKETLEKKANVSFANIICNFKKLFGNKKFKFFLLIKVASVVLLFCEISNMPLIFIEHMGVDAKLYGWYVLPVFLLYVLANLLSTWLIKKMPVINIVKLGVVCIFISNFLLIVLFFLIKQNAIIIQIIKSLTYIGWGLIFGNAIAEIVSAVHGLSGLASAVMISFEMLCSSIGVFLLSSFFSGDILPLSIFMASISLGLAFIFLKVKTYNYRWYNCNEKVLLFYRY